MLQLASETDQTNPPSHPLMAMRLLKAIPEGADGPWRIRGVASDETQDIEGDRILRKSIDVSYAARRGYVNWDHGKGPADQIGYLTKCEILDEPKIEELSKSIPEITSTSTIYIEGELYKHVKRAQETHDLMKSVPDGAPGLGLSLDGMLARDKRSMGVVKAFVHGIAITPAPCHPATVAHLKKSLAAYRTLFDGEGALPSDFTAAIADEVMDRLRKHLIGATSSSMSHDEAVLFILRKRPRWSYELASRLVKYTQQKTGRSLSS